MQPPLPDRRAVFEAGGTQTTEEVQDQNVDSLIAEFKDRLKKMRRKEQPFPIDFKRIAEDQLSKELAQDCESKSLHDLQG